MSKKKKFKRMIRHAWSEIRRMDRAYHNTLFDPRSAGEQRGGLGGNGKSGRVDENTPQRVLTDKTIKPGEAIKLASDEQPVQA